MEKSVFIDTVELYVNIGDSRFVSLQDLALEKEEGLSPDDRQIYFFDTDKPFVLENEYYDSQFYAMDFKELTETFKANNQKIYKGNVYINIPFNINYINEVFNNIKENTETLDENTYLECFAPMIDAYIDMDKKMEQKDNKGRVTQPSFVVISDVENLTKTELCEGLTTYQAQQKIDKMLKEDSFLDKIAEDSLDDLKAM